MISSENKYNNKFYPINTGDTVHVSVKRFLESGSNFISSGSRIIRPAPAHTGHHLLTRRGPHVKDLWYLLGCYQYVIISYGNVKLKQKRALPCNNFVEHICISCLFSRIELIQTIFSECRGRYTTLDF